MARYSGARTRSEGPFRDAWDENHFGISVAQGQYDVYEWEGKHSVQLWEASWEQSGVVEPDVRMACGRAR
jgi:hypothetical protein